MANFVEPEYIQRMSLLNFVVFGAVLAFCYVWANQRKERRRNPTGAPRPPGPKPLPFIGNLFDVPQGDEAGTFTKWAREYGMYHIV